MYTFKKILKVVCLMNKEKAILQDIVISCKVIFASNFMHNVKEKKGKV